VIRGVESQDNAGVYRLTGEIALVQTVDYFTPVVDDPFAFGQIAAANSLSDIYAMGAKPLTAMNLVSFPRDALDLSVLREILRGGLDKMNEARVVLVGGHTVDDPELKYGLSVTGTVHPNRLVTNGGARIGDKLILTKPLGTGIISTALKNGGASKEAVDGITRSMAALNYTASALMVETGVDACTDITGFGLLGHALQMAKNSGVGFLISASSVPLFPMAEELSGRGFQAGGLGRNRDYYGGSVQFGPNVPQPLRDILFDPQTSGGLLMSLAPTKARRLVSAMKRSGIEEAAIVGEVMAEPRGKILVG
jgi:selenide,water dikinase